MVAKSIVFALVLVAGCSSENLDARRDAPAAETSLDAGAQLPDESPEPSPPTVERPLLPTPAVTMPVLSWSFEPASADCNGWPVVGADAIRASPARSGAYSCKVCADGSNAGLGIMRELDALAPGRYELTAWVRKRAQNAAPGEARARIEAATAGGIVDVSTPTVAIREEWDRLETTLDLSGGATSVRLTIGAVTADVDHCLFVDDVTLTRLP